MIQVQGSVSRRLPDSAANARLTVSERADGGKTFTVTVYNSDAALSARIPGARPDERPVLVVDGKRFEGYVDPRIETKYLGTTPEGWDIHQMKLELPAGHEPKSIKARLRIRAGEQDVRDLSVLKAESTASNLLPNAQEMRGAPARDSETGALRAVAADQLVIENKTLRSRDRALIRAVTEQRPDMTVGELRDLFKGSLRSIAQKSAAARAAVLAASGILLPGRAVGELAAQGAMAGAAGIS